MQPRQGELLPHPGLLGGGETKDAFSELLTFMRPGSPCGLSHLVNAVAERTSCSEESNPARSSTPDERLKGIRDVSSVCMQTC